jgi:hypothetical protein
MKHLTAILRMVDHQMDLSTHKGIISGCEVEMVISNVWSDILLDLVPYDSKSRNWEQSAVEQTHLTDLASSLSVSQLIFSQPNQSPIDRKDIF